MPKFIIILAIFVTFSCFWSIFSIDLILKFDFLLNLLGLNNKIQQKSFSFLHNSANQVRKSYPSITKKEQGNGFKKFVKKTK